MWYHCVIDYGSIFLSKSNSRSEFLRGIIRHHGGLTAFDYETPTERGSKILRFVLLSVAEDIPVKLNC